MIFYFLFSSHLKIKRHIHFKLKFHNVNNVIISCNVGCKKTFEKWKKIFQIIYGLKDMEFSNTTFVQSGPTYLPLDIINLKIYCTSLSCRPTSFLAKLLFFKECVLLHLYYGWIFNYHMSFESFMCFMWSPIHNLPWIPFIIIYFWKCPQDL